ncbi:HAD family hydrolase [Aliarcobacter cryaerophilus]|uniref:HAD family hydrolase n=1 Tax=Aliarcobacter cryaerophilus TaxID=28198 RepID=UPI0021B6015B|nr:HAD family hydrolase [Aliarcobacter cryaerophilus]MCT7520064.1 HAD hydrolase-like protein [Aliarcobacter cryaerophilus]
MFDYIFLDLDGPILEGKFRHYTCYKYIIKKYGGNVIDVDAYWELKRGKVTRDILLEKSNFRESYEVFFKEWMNTIENEEYLRLDTLKPNVVETLKSWKNITDKIVLVTMRQNREYLLNQLDRLGILCLLNEVIDCPPQRKNTKYEALKDKIFNNAIFIGDTEEDTNTAKMLGIKSIGITNGLRDKKFLEADYYYEEIKDIDFNRLEINK